MSSLTIYPFRRQMLLMITAITVLGLCTAGVVRSYMGLGIEVPLRTGLILLPCIGLVGLWDYVGWRGLRWLEATVYVGMVLAAQAVMLVDVSSALYFVPVIGAIYRDWRLSLYSAVLGAIAFIGIGIVEHAGEELFALQIGAHVVLLCGFALVSVKLIGLTRQVEDLTVRARLAQQMARQWAISIEARDGYTGGHVERVTEYALTLAPHVPGLEMDLEAFRLACTLHDVGKIGVPDAVLNKPDRLTPEEYRIMQAHTTTGYEMVLNSGATLEIARLVRHHHERWDGHGYPDGLAGHSIPLSARVLAVADVFDALTTDRPYRRALTATQARELIVGGAGSQFDPQVVQAFRQVYASWEKLLQQRMTDV